jgi:hypothetical protein
MSDTPETPPEPAVPAEIPVEVPPAVEIPVEPPKPDEPAQDLFPESAPIPVEAAEMVQPYESPNGANPDGTAKAPDQKRGRGRPIIHGRYSAKGPVQTTQGTVTPPDFDKIIPPGPSPTTVSTVNYDELAGMFFDMGAGAMSALLGPEWQPSGKEERKAVVQALSAYLRSKEIKDIPPNVALTIALCAYAAPRCFQPNTRGKLAAAWGWTKDRVKLAWAWFRVTFRKKKP